MLVVKLGGAMGISHQNLIMDAAQCIKKGEKVVIVHGGSDAANALSLQLGIPSRHITSPSGVQSRYTDRATLEVLLMACAGRLNKLIVEALQQAGVNAVGLSGIDGGLLTGSRKKAVKAVEGGKTLVIRDDQSGQIEKVNVQLLNMLLDAGFTPVISSLAISHEGTALNVDADRAASKVAVALGAKKMVLLTNVPGVLENLEDPTSVIKKIKVEELDSYQSFAKGRMKKKLLAAGEAVRGGVKQVIIGDARCENPLLNATQGKGTVITL